MRTPVRLLVIACITGALPRLGLAQAPQQPPADLARLSIEELLNVEVTTVSRKEQRADTAPAAIYVLTQDEIRRSGIRTLPELFRLVPGVQVAQVNSSNWAISVRGFNDVYANKLLVLIDGRSIYNRGFSGVFWNSEDLLIDDIDRIEVVRGPGGSMWGANAVNGVINIVTKSAYETRGPLVRVGYGTFDGNQLAARYGGTLGSAAFRVFSQWSDHQDSLAAPDTSADDEWHTLTNGARLDWERGRRSVTLAGGFTASESRPLWLVLTSPVPEVPRVTDGIATRHTGFVLGRLTQTFANGSSLQVQSFFDHRWANDPDNRSTENTSDVDLEYHARVGKRQDLVMGGGVRGTLGTTHGTFSYTEVPADCRDAILNVFAQDEIAIAGRLRLTLGSKLEHDTVAGFGVAPTARLGWTVVPGRHFVWTAISRAIRTPSSVDLGVLANVSASRLPDGTPLVIGVDGNPAYQSEHAIDTEVGYRAKLHATFDVDIAAFRGRYNGGTTYEPQTPEFVQGPIPYLRAPVKFENLLDATTEGVDASAHWTPLRTWRLDASYSGFHFTPHPRPDSIDPTAAHRDGNAPANQWQVHSSVWLGQRAELNASVFHVGRLRYFDVPAYTRADVRFALKIVKPLSIVAVGQNLLEPSHLEYSSAEIGMMATRVPRSGSVHLVWRLGAGS